jgi:hypothetical protein
MAVVAHVVGDEYDITAVPAETPVTTADEEPTVATPVEPLDHVPPGVASSRVVVELTQTVKVPVMAAGSGLTETTTERAQPVAGNVYEIVLVPIAEPVTTPPAVIGATPELELVQLPPGVVLESVLVVPRQTDADPVIAAGSPFTVTTFVVLQLATV